MLVALGGRIVRDQVEQHLAALEPAAELVRLGVGDVDAGDQDKLDEHRAVRRVDVAVERAHQLVQRVRLCARHEAEARRLRRRVEREREVDGRRVGGERAHAADDADGRHGDPRRRHRPELDEPVQRREDGPVIVQRFAHAHKDDVRDAPVAAERRRRALDVPDLLKDLTRRQVALEAHAARGAKCAAHPAADLGRDAHRDPAARAAFGLVHDRDRLDERAVVESDDELEAGVGFGGDGALDG